MSTTVRILHEMVSWLFVVIDLAAIVICFLHAARSVWARVLAGSFALQFLVALSYRILSHVSWSSPETVPSLYLVASLGGLLAAVLLVAGIAGLLAQVAGMSARPGPAPLNADPVDPA
jgi:hypothetical protein